MFVLFIVHFAVQLNCKILGGRICAFELMRAPLSLPLSNIHHAKFST